VEEVYDRIGWGFLATLEEGLKLIDLYKFITLAGCFQNLDDDVGKVGI
jgi:hypothetical protein